MDENTLKALEASIRKWESDEPGGTTEDCPLCQLFFLGRPCGLDELGRLACIGCPIMAKTGKPSCYDTPFYDWVEAEEEGNMEAEAFYRRRMASFLRSLHPNFDPDEEALRD